jgi:hypothetical protein
VLINLLSSTDVGGRNLKGTLMTMTRLLTATAFVALLAGPVAAQTTNTPSSGQTSDVEGETPATDDTTTQPATTTPPVAPGDRVATGDSSTTSMPSQTSTSGSMQTQGSMGRGSTNAGGTMGTTASGNMNAGGTRGATASGNMNAGGSMGSMAAGGMMTSMNGNVRVTSNAPIPDTAENRARYGQPESNAGRSRVGEGATAELRGPRRKR